jgi:lipoprotein-anchoring transpeptidase ErfK/SrfK
MLKRPGKRFGHPFDSNLVRLHKNLYMNRSDPRYYEKIIRYLNPTSPEAHYRIAQRFEAEGDTARAARHYMETMKQYPSDFYAPAARALRKLQAAALPPSGKLVPPGPDEPQRPRLPLRLLVSLLIMLILLNAALLLLLLMAEAVPRMNGSVMHSPAGGKEPPGAGTKPYDHRAPEPDDAIPDRQALTAVKAAANYVRTALLAYRRDHGVLPPDIALLAADYPGNYVSFIPREPVSGSGRVVTAYDGTGGWVYDAGAAEAAASFYPNRPPGPDSGGVPYEPFRIVVGKSDHALLLLMGSTVLMHETVGIGEQGKTPDGTMTVKERVKEPAGQHPGVYGSAALGLGTIAIHGTLQPESVGADMSKGCIRVQNGEMAALYELVPRGAAVNIGDRLPPSYASAENGIKLLPDGGRKARNEHAPAGTVFHWLG